ncbi:hypothetical protein ACQJBY_039304 [Aegilops geniculata]
MEAAVASALTKEVVVKLVTLLSERHKLSKGLKDDLRFIHTELHMILCDMDERHPTRRPQVVSMEEMRDLAHDIEDCIDRFLPCAACEGEAASVLRRVKKAVTGNKSRFAAEIRKLRQRVKDAHERRVNYGVNGGGSAAGAAPPAAVDAAETDPVGIEKPRQELVELLLGREQGAPSVISIVGFGGSGKTTLARAVYCCPGVVQRFAGRAWAAGSEHTDAGGLLTAILRQLHHTADVPQDQDSIPIDDFLRTTE